MSSCRCAPLNPLPGPSCPIRRAPPEAGKGQAKKGPTDQSSTEKYPCQTCCPALYVVSQSSECPQAGCGSTS